MCTLRGSILFWGNPRELLINVWVQKQYLEYQQVPGCDPACYQFLWDPRAYAESSKRKVLSLLLKINKRKTKSFYSSDEPGNDRWRLLAVNRRNPSSFLSSKSGGR